MGNGGCNCNVQNFNFISPTKIKVVKTIYIKFDKININFTLKENKFNDLYDKEIDFYFCEKYSIGPFLNNNIKNLLSNSLINNYEKSYKEFIKFIDKDDSIIKLDNIKSYKVIVNKIISDLLIKKINSENLNSGLLINNIFLYNWDNSIRIILYNLFLPNESKKNMFTNDKLILKENEDLTNIENENIPNIENDIIAQIERDIIRTFPNLKIFEENIFCDNLKKCLLEIAKIDKELSYLQGMNFMIAFLLILAGNEKEITINFFLRIINLKSEIFNITFRECLTDNFRLVFMFYNKLKEILKLREPKILEIFDYYEINKFFWFSKWIQTLFTFKFKFELVIKFWDIIVYKGIDSIILIILAIIEYFSPKIKKIKSLEEFMTICELIYEMKEYNFSSFLIFILNKINSKEYKNYLNI